MSDLPAPKEREVFEAWARDDAFCFRDECGLVWPDGGEVEAWSAWQARAAIAESDIKAALGEPVGWREFLAEFVNLCEVCDINEHMEPDGYGWRGLYLRAKKNLAAATQAVQDKEQPSDHTD